MNTLRNAIDAAIKAVAAARMLRADTDEGFAQRVGFMPHEERAHLLEMFEIGSAINELESALRILGALDSDIIACATPAPIYGMWDGFPVTVPAGHVLVPEGEYPEKLHMRLVVRSGQAPAWRLRAAPHIPHKARVYGHPGEPSMVIAYANKVK